MRLDAPTGIVLFQSRDSLGYEEWEREVRAAMEVLDGPIRRVLSDRRRMSFDFEPGMVERAIGFFRTHAHDVGEAQWAILVTSESAPIRLRRQP